ncbi:transcriptional regulator of sugar metabolism [Singulisphaera acidiphila DSM 18658]|uniref:Transcriptional regulator of sugar metabolism n=1 Tax=Singulisphaera acidiphila (strain ATCC BAA-1392 / DSM 18658 / VKM B-2454 / MOB10) TaxID=886293 RepID=L0DIT8_SINAD|nr:transcriptional regulator of sugar metabolism [Singulisphaera acidiphila DSM 18658]
MMRYDRSLAIVDRLDSLVSLIRNGAHSTLSLVERLGVSDQTISRGIPSLQRRGYAIKAIEQASGWAYRLESESSELVQGKGSSGT